MAVWAGDRGDTVRYRVRGTYHLRFRRTIWFRESDEAHKIAVDTVIEAGSATDAIDIVTYDLSEETMESDDEFIVDNVNDLTAKPVTEEDDAEIAEIVELNERLRTYDLMRRFAQPLIEL